MNAHLTHGEWVPAQGIRLIGQVVHARLHELEVVQSEIREAVRVLLDVMISGVRQTHL